MYGPFKGMSAANPKRVDFSLRDDRGNMLQVPGFVEDCSPLTQAIQEAVDDFLEAFDYQIQLPPSESRSADLLKVFGLCEI